jgi:hypothetical protein
VRREEKLVQTNRFTSYVQSNVDWHFRVVGEGGETQMREGVYRCRRPVSRPSLVQYAISDAVNHAPSPGACAGTSAWDMEE